MSSVFYWTHEWIVQPFNRLHYFRGVNNMLPDRFDKVMFEKSLRNAILDCLPDLVFAKYSGALRWFTLLVSTSSTFVSQSQISEACLNLLLEVTKEMAKRSNQYTSLLRTRYACHTHIVWPILLPATLLQIWFVWSTLRTGSVWCRATVDCQVQFVTEHIFFDYNQKCTSHTATEYDHRFEEILLSRWQRTPNVSLTNTSQRH